MFAHAASSRPTTTANSTRRGIDAASRSVARPRLPSRSQIRGGSCGSGGGAVTMACATHGSRSALASSSETPGARRPKVRQTFQRRGLASGLVVAAATCTAVMGTTTSGDTEASMP